MFKFSIEKKVFHSYLTALAAFVDHKSNAGALQTIKLQLDESGILSISASNGSCYVTVKTPVQKFSLDKNNRSSICVNENFVKLISNCNGIIALEFDTQKLSVKLSNLTNKSTMVCLPDDNFPLDKSTVSVNTPIYTADISTFAWLVHSVSFAATNESDKQILQGVSLTFNANQLKAIATDGYVAAVNTIAIQSPQLFKVVSNAIVHSEFLNNILPVLDFSNIKTIDIFITDDAVILKNDTISIYVKTFSGKYPDLSSIQLIQYQNVFSVDLKTIENALSFAANFEESNGAIELDVDNSFLYVAAYSQFLGEAINEIPINVVSGSKLTGLFQSRYFKRCLSRMKDDVIVAFANESSPLRISNSSNANYTLYLMPFSGKTKRNSP